MDSKASIGQHSAPEEKITLFRSLFRGRDDVYPRRFESRRTGKSGYAPACANEWVRGVCEKPRSKCTDCPHRRQLQAQWVERLSAFLGVPPKSIGQIGGGRKKPTGILDLAIIQSLIRKGVVNDLVGQYNGTETDAGSNGAIGKYSPGSRACVARDRSLSRRGF